MLPKIICQSLFQIYAVSVQISVSSVQIYIETYDAGVQFLAVIRSVSKRLFEF
jgi:hypothetical protein